MLFLQFIVKKIQNYFTKTPSLLSHVIKCDSAGNKLLLKTFKLNNDINQKSLF